MRTNGTLKTQKLWLIALALLPLFFSNFSNAQSTSGADFVFINHSLVSGTARAKGAVYLFPSVRNGVDCYVTIVDITPKTTIPTFDDNTAGTGFREAFQPKIQVEGKTRGYAEFMFRFVKAGTNIDTLMNEIPATSIDVDGNRSGSDSLLEFDEYFLPSTYLVDFDMLAGDLSFNFSAGSIIGRNKAAQEHVGIDTVDRSVMFSVVYPHASTFTVRIGVDNTKSNSDNRQRSVYFKRFVYPHSFLPVRGLRSFTAASQNNAVKLNWTMNLGHDIVAADVEKSVNGAHFTRVSSVSMASELQSSYTDNNVNGNVYYRLKMTNATGKVSYSEVLLVKSSQAHSGFKVFPSVIDDYTTVNFSAANAGTATLMIADNNGRIVKQQAVSVQQGVNTAMVNGLGQLPAGQYVAVLRGAGYNFTQKIFITK